MEKYSSFADPRTGINPFIPSWVNNRAPIWLRGLRYTAMMPIAAARVLLLFPVLIWVILVDLITWPLGICGKYGRTRVRRTLTGWAFTFALQLFGIIPSHIQADPQRLKIRPEKRNSYEVLNSLPRLSSSSVILSNFSTFSDILYFSSAYRCPFIFIHSDNSLSIHSWLSAIILSLRHTAPRTAGTYRNLVALHQDLQRQGCGPAVLFIEGHKSNNEVILSWKKGCLCTNEEEAGTLLNTLKQHCVVALIQYSKSMWYAAPHTVYGGLYHMFRLTLEPYQRMTVYWTTHYQTAELLSTPSDIMRTSTTRTGPSSNAMTSIKGDLSEDLRRRAHDKASAVSVPSVVDVAAEFLRLSAHRMAPGSILIDYDGTRAGNFASYFEETQRKGYVAQQRGVLSGPQVEGGQVFNSHEAKKIAQMSRGSRR